VDTDRRRVCFLATGGTLGMRQHGPGPLAPSAVAEDVLAYVRGLEREVDVEVEQVCNLDSSDMGSEHWLRLGGRIVERYAEFDGFVILHGTDTMAYTACALSFSLRSLGKPVVLTGAQRPLASVRTDARANIVHAALCAAMDIPEVAISFGPWLFRGNRATKTSVQSYEAFESPGLGPLVELGVDVRRPTPCLHPSGELDYRAQFSGDIALLSVVPGTAPSVIDAAVEAGARGLVLRGFGAGNVPQRGWPDAIRSATDAGVLVAMRTQCTRGTVDLGAYAGGRAAADAGAVGTGAMTVEASTVKLMHLLGLGLAGDDLRSAYAAEIAGEGSEGAAGFAML
jgi:L-asparaginase